MVTPQKKKFRPKIFGSGCGKEILRCFTGKSLYAVYLHQTDHSRKISCQRHKLHGFILIWQLEFGSLWKWSAVGMSNLFTYLLIL